MKIYTYYHYAAMTSLHASIVALIPPFLLVCVGVILNQHRSILLFTLPFIVYSFISYQIYLVNKQRKEDSKEPVVDQLEESIVSSTMALQFLPSPSLRMLLFRQDGQLSAEIKDIHQHKLRWFIPYFLDQFFPKVYAFSKFNKEIYTFILKGKNISIMLNDGNKCVASIHKKAPKRYVIESKWSTREVFVQSSSLFTDVKLCNARGDLLARVRRGYLPRDWDKHIKDVNTPILTVSDQVTDLEKVIILAILTKIYRYRNH